MAGALTDLAVIMVPSVGAAVASRWARSGVWAQCLRSVDLGGDVTLAHAVGVPISLPRKAILSKRRQPRSIQLD